MERAFIGPTAGTIVSRNALYLVVSALMIATLVIGYQLYQEQRIAGIDIHVGGAGISIETKWSIPPEGFERPERFSSSPENRPFQVQ